MSDINSIRKIFNSSISFDRDGIGRPNEFMNAIILLLEVIENIQNNCDCFSFDDLVASLLEGTNINFDTDNIDNTITINSSGGSIDIEMDENVFDGDGTIITPYTLRDFGDGKIRGNKDGVWEEVVVGDIKVDSNIFDGDGSVADPYTLKDFEDGKIYGNMNGAWVECECGGGGTGWNGCAENVSCLVTLPPSEVCVEGGAENVSCLI